MATLSMDANISCTVLCGLQTYVWYDTIDDLHSEADRQAASLI